MYTLKSPDNVVYCVPVDSYCKYWTTYNRHWFRWKRYLNEQHGSTGQLGREETSTIRVSHIVYEAENPVTSRELPGYLLIFRRYGDKASLRRTCCGYSKVLLYSFDMCHNICCKWLLKSVSQIVTRQLKFRHYVRVSLLFALLLFFPAGWKTKNTEFSNITSFATT